MKFSSTFAIIIGIGMIGQWAFSFFSGNIPELANEPIRIGFHLAAELITALCLIGSGIALLLHKKWAYQIYFVALGMLFYTTVVSPGYFAQRGEWLWLGLFSFILCGVIFSIIRLKKMAAS